MEPAAPLIILTSGKAASLQSVPVAASTLLHAGIGTKWQAISLAGEDTLAVMQIHSDGSRTMIRLTIDTEEEGKKSRCFRQYWLTTTGELKEVALDPAYQLNKPKAPPPQGDASAGWANIPLFFD